MIEKIIKDFDNFLRAHGMNQGDGAKLLKISQAQLSRIFNRKRNPSVALLKKMEEIMGEYV